MYKKYEKFIAAIILISFFALIIFNIMKYDIGEIDEVGDVPYSFIDIKKIYFELDDYDVVCIMQLVSMPKIFIANNDNICVNCKEYSWGVIFDIDGSSNVSINDIEISSTNFKWDFSKEGKYEFPYFTQNNVWIYKEDSDGDITVETIDNVELVVKLISDALVFEFSTIDNNALKNITIKSPVYFFTYFDDGENVYNRVVAQ